ncbi:TetR/AcrR family transcriptional regulator [Actinocrispum wychmicini]|uniref:TetR family transcriptional regulator n=1 Tax=Actinocrispum wychmicini TaxID=1213861 RepID=A0A4R2JL82_9PSEU|nr:TetR/AcrR family transcriptional regulator C-terminal domain-containing protein [Actinocrispum wychmicini]TCO59617.1 TetR family transcriptional regulator [Actinocrispum wychmicini]
MTPQPKVQKSQRLPRGALDRDTVIAAALEIADRDGLSGVTMARVAEALGGSPMSLYRHLNDKQELLDAVVDLALSESPRIAQDGRPWRVRLEEFASESRLNALRHPALIEIHLENTVRGPGAAAVGLDVIDLLHQAGFDEDSSIRAFMALRNYLLGAMAWEVSRFRGGGEEFAHQVSDTFVHEDTPVDSPLRRLGEVLSVDPEGQFMFGLDRLLDGFETELRRIKRKAGQKQ